MEPTLIRLATAIDADAIAEMADALLVEIMSRIGSQAFDSDKEAMRAQLVDSLPGEQHFVILAERDGKPVGFAALSPAYSLYTNGAFGLITELFVVGEFRSQGIGKALLGRCQAFAREKHWSQLEVTTPPLPEFDRTLHFYEKHGFAITGGRKLKIKT